MLNLAILMDPIASINVKYDTSLRLYREAKARGWKLWYLEPRHLFLKEGTVYLEVSPIEVFDQDDPFYKLGEAEVLPASAMDLLLVRKDPPFDIDYVTLTYLLEMAQSQGVQVFNSPRSLRDANEKLFTCWFSELMAPTLVTQRLSLMQPFLQTHHEVVIKPLDLMGGRMIYRAHVSDGTADKKFLELSEQESRMVLVQKFLPEVSDQGDKRVFIVDGEPYQDVLVRKPQAGDFKANMASGGSISLGKLSPKDKDICAHVGPVLKRMGILFAGLDIIGEHLSEINVTSPTGIPALESLTHTNLAKPILDACVRHLKAI